MRKEKLMIYLPLLGLIVLIILLYSPEITATHVPVLSDLNFDEKTNITLTFSIAIFAAIEGYATFKRAKMEENRHLIADARNELEKAYGPLYTLLSKVCSADKDKGTFWLDFEERKKIDEIMATYPFMFPTQIYSLWQEKIRSLQSPTPSSSLETVDVEFNMKVYIEFGKKINEEYERRVRKYHELIEK